jgi:hypothetical protein
MAFIRASQGGGGLSETTIWTNNSPGDLFPITTITLNNGYRISDFKYLKFVFRYATDNMTTSSIIVDTNDFINSLEESDHMAPSIVFKGSSAVYVRQIYYYSDTQIIIYMNKQVEGYANTNEYTIPIRIIGLK